MSELSARFLHFFRRLSHHTNTPTGIFIQGRATDIKRRKTSWRNDIYVLAEGLQALNDVSCNY